VSATTDLLPEGAVVYDSLDLLAPQFAAAIRSGLVEFPDAMVYESYRTNALQQLYYARGRTVKPPDKPVTNASTNLYSWHGYGLAVDIIHRELRWSAGDIWFRKMTEIFKHHGCKAGLEWKHPDPPHIQWGLCRASPSDKAREILAKEGLHAVWEVVRAI
jgi:D-alanyl-D-alanine carboxypeptidase